MSQDKADTIKIQTDDVTILDERRKDEQDHHSLLVVSVSAKDEINVPIALSAFRDKGS